MLLLMIEKEMPIDCVLYADTGVEFPETRDHIAKLDKLLCRERGIPLVAGLTCGHSLPTMSLPLGATVQLKAGADGSFLFRPAAAGDNT